MKSYSLLQYLKINTYLHNLLNSKLSISSNNDHINNLKEYGYFAEQTICQL